MLLPCFEFHEKQRDDGHDGEVVDVEDLVDRDVGDIHDAGDEDVHFAGVFIRAVQAVP